MSGEFIQHTAHDFLKYTEAELLQKRFFANLCIQAAKEGQAEGDPRAGRALAHYRAERQTINTALKIKRGNPSPQVVDLNPVNFGARARQ